MFTPKVLVVVLGAVFAFSGCDSSTDSAPVGFRVEETPLQWRPKRMTRRHRLMGPSRRAPHRLRYWITIA